MTFNTKRGQTFLGLLILPIALLVAACGTSTSRLAAAGPHKVRNAYEVTLNQEWSRFNLNNGSYFLTRDGSNLNMIHFTDGLRPGESILVERSKENPVPEYKKGMTPFELIEFMTDTLSALGLQDMKTSDMKPAPFGTETGFSFKFNGAYPNGLFVSGDVLVAEFNNRLYTIFYLAPKEHYYNAYLSDVLALFASVRLVGK